MISHVSPRSHILVPLPTPRGRPSGDAAPFLVAFSALRPCSLMTWRSLLGDWTLRDWTLRDKVQSEVAGKSRARGQAAWVGVWVQCSAPRSPRLQARVTGAPSSWRSRGDGRGAEETAGSSPAETEAHPQPPPEALALTQPTQTE